MDNEYLNIIVKRPGEAPHEEAVCSKNLLRELQGIVGGYIEVFSYGRDRSVICNEEGLIRNLDYNCTYADNHFFGPILWIGIDGEDFCSSPETVETVRRRISLDV